VNVIAILRRAVLLPTVVVFEVLFIAASPILVAAAAVVAVICRSSRPLRSVALVLAYAGIELQTLARILRGVDDWDGLVCDVLDDSYNAMRRVLDVPLVLEEGSVAAGDLGRSNGLIVLARHCGPGDSLFVAWLLAVHYDLSLRIVLKRVLRAEPVIDLAAEKLPLCFVGGRRSAKAGIADLASTLSRGDALLLFPEGNNFSWPRWHAAIQELRDRGQHLTASRARRRTHTLPPHLGGALAALSAAPHADVLLLAHSGFSQDGRDRVWWRVPIRQQFVVRTLLIPADHVPRDEDRVRAFLDRAWAQVDTWVEGHVDLRSVADQPDETVP
jgi:1-acyl-sn-glycerol-3-phosphate acyltransferase